jgi:cytoskeletal protein RodZ
MAEAVAQAIEAKQHLVVEAGTGVEAPEVIVTEPESTTTGVIAVEPESTPAISAQPVPPEVISRTAPSGSDQVRIIVNADTWADIEDSTGHKLIYDLLRADESILLTGEAPFIAFFGNGHGVEVMLNNQEIDITSRIRDNNTARVKIGG